MNTPRMCSLALLVLVLVQVSLAQDAEATRIDVLGQKDKMELLNQGGSLAARKAQTGPMTNQEIEQSLVVAGVPKVPSVAVLEAPKVAPKPDDASGTQNVGGVAAVAAVTPVPDAVTQPSMPAKAEGSHVLAADAAIPPISAPQAGPPSPAAAPQPQAEVLSIDLSPVAKKATEEKAKALAAELEPLPVDILKPDDRGFIQISAVHRKEVRSPFDPARVIFATPEENSLRVDGVVIGKLRVASIGKSYLIAGENLPGSTLAIQSIRPDGVIIRLRSGVRFFAPIARDIRIISEE